MTGFASRDFAAGLLFTLLGVGFGAASLRYGLGTAARLGPGLFPLLVAGLLAILGVAITVEGARRPDTEMNGPVGRWAMRPLVCVLAANVVFGAFLCGVPEIGLPPLGLVLATYGAVIVASHAEPRPAWPMMLTLASVLAAITYGAFIVGLRLPMPAWPVLGG